MYANRIKLNETNIMTVSINQIKKAVDAVAAYKQKDIQKTFSGQKIVWNLELKDVNTWVPSSIKIDTENELTIFCTGPYSYPWVYFKINLEEYPEVKLFHEGSKLKVSATIYSMEGVTVVLNNIENIELLEDQSREKDVSQLPVLQDEADIGFSKKIPWYKSSFLKKIVLHPVYSLIIGAIFIASILIFTGIDIRNYFPTSLNETSSPPTPTTKTVTSSLETPSTSGTTVTN